MARVPYSELDTQTRGLIEAINSGWIARGIQIAIGFWIASLIPVAIVAFVIAGLASGQR
ncbi:MAG: hypothetical protein KGL39_43385 [Patescibacteria group bacterium]|nr:hypothetical protein [Patescibacteria group bacterium]